MGIVAVLIAVMLFAVGCPATEPAEEPETPDEVTGRIIWSTYAEPAGFNPILQGGHNERWTWERVFASLIRIDENLEPEGEIAEDWEISEDGLEYTFYLRDDVFFHDGEQLTAEDVAFTYNAIKDPGYTGYAAGQFESLEYAEVVDEYTVRLILSEPYSPLMSRLFIGILPKHLYDAEPVADMMNNPYNRAPIGAGPFKFETFDPGQHTIVVANEDYFGEGPYTAEQRQRIVSDQDVAVAALEAGEIDYLYVTGTTRARLMEQYADRLDFYDWERLGTDFLQLNHLSFGLDDVRVRQALSHAINQDAIVDDILEGMGMNIYGPLPTTSWAYDEQVIQKFPYDPEQAVALLEEAGFQQNTDGIFEKDGQPLTWRAFTNAGNTRRESVLLLAQDNLSDIGIELQLEFLDWGIMQDEHLWKGDFDMVLQGIGWPPDPDQYDRFHSSQAERDADGRFRGMNHSSFKNDEIDRLLERGRTEPDPEIRKQIYSDYQALWSELQPWIQLHGAIGTGAVTNDIGGVVIGEGEGPIKPWLWYRE